VSAKLSGRRSSAGLRRHLPFIEQPNAGDTVLRTDPRYQRESQHRRCRDVPRSEVASTQRSGQPSRRTRSAASPASAQSRRCGQVPARSRPRPSHNSVPWPLSQRWDLTWIRPRASSIDPRRASHGPDTPEAGSFVSRPVESQIFIIYAVPNRHLGTYPAAHRDAVL